MTKLEELVAKYGAKDASPGLATEIADHVNATLRAFGRELIAEAADVADSPPFNESAIASAIMRLVGD